MQCLQMRQTISMTIFEFREGYEENKISLLTVFFEEPPSDLSSSMQVLQLIRRMSVLCGICSVQEEKLFVRFPHIVIIMINLFLAELFNLRFAVYQLQKGDIVQCLFACFQFASVLSTIGGYITIIRHRGNVCTILDELQRVFDQGNVNGNPRERSRKIIMHVLDSQPLALRLAQCICVWINCAKCSWKVCWFWWKLGLSGLL